MKVLSMSIVDPTSSNDKAELARRQSRGERLHSNQVSEINRAIAAGDKNVIRAAQGK